MSKTLWEQYYEANWSVSCIPWRVYDAGNHNKLLCSDYTSLQGDNTIIDDMEVVSCRVVNRPSNAVPQVVNIYVR